jgi:hypothetical protein
MKINQSKAKISITRPKDTSALPKNTTSNAAIAAEAVAGTAPTDSIKKQEPLKNNQGVSLRVALFAVHGTLLQSLTRPNNKL